VRVRVGVVGVRVGVRMSDGDSFAGGRMDGWMDGWMESATCGVDYWVSLMGWDGKEGDETSTPTSTSTAFSWLGRLAGCLGMKKLVTRGFHVIQMECNGMTTACLEFSTIMMMIKIPFPFIQSTPLRCVTSTVLHTSAPSTDLICMHVYTHK